MEPPGAGGALALIDPINFFDDLLDAYEIINAMHPAAPHPILCLFVRSPICRLQVRQFTQCPPRHARPNLRKVKQPPQKAIKVVMAENLAKAGALPNDLGLLTGTLPHRYSFYLF